MNFDELSDYCLTKMGARLDYPFGSEPAVYKIADKMFALLTEENNTARISLKCEPLRADFLRQQYSSVIPGYHLNKTHWNTVICDGSIPDEEVKEQVDHSYELIWNSLSKKTRIRLEAESHPLYLFPDDAYEPRELQEGEEYYPNGIFIFNVTRILEYILDNQDDFVIEMVKTRDYKPIGDLIDYEKCSFSDLNKPIVLAEISPGRYNVIDGHHRVSKALHEGVESLPAYKLPPEQHSLFITKQKAYDVYLGYWNDKLKYLTD